MPAVDARLDRDHFYRFYGADLSYFSAKVRPALRYKRIPFVEILPTPQVYREVIIPRTGLAFIPIVITADDEALQDTSEILDQLEQRFPDPPLDPTDPVLRVAAWPSSRTSLDQAHLPQ
jgi:glutathione S-transferase